MQSKTTFKQTIHRKVCLYRMTFPDILDLNYLIEDAEKSGCVDENTTSLLTGKSEIPDVNDDDSKCFSVLTGNKWKQLQKKK